MSAATFAAAADDSLACEPTAQFFDGVAQWWLQRFDAKRAECTTNTDVNIVFLGDSITHNWETQGKKVWAENFAEGPYKAVNCGISADRTENLIWRLEHGQLGPLVPKAFVLLIGTNNLGHRDSPCDTIAAIRRIVALLRIHYPTAKVVLHPIFPRGAKADVPSRVRNEIVNRQIRFLADGERILWCDFNAKLLEADGTLTREMAPDLLHPSEAGYRIWASELKTFLDFALGRASVAPAGAAQSKPADCGKAADVPHMCDWIDIRTAKKRGEIERNKGLYYDAVMIGDSITHNWEDHGEVVQRELLGDFKILNLGFGGDKTQDILWMVGEGGLLDGFLTRSI
jgi:lysophospholipase L1-like esterase